MYRILIVDDEMHIRNSLQTILDWGRLGCAVVGEAASAEEASGLLETRYPDILICDIELGGKSGLELARKIKNDGHDIKMIFLTGYDKFSYAKEAIRSNATEYLLKPVNPQMLETAVKKATSELAQRREIQRENALFRELVETSKDILCENFLKQLAFSLPVSLDAIEERIAFLGLRFDVYQAAVLEVDSFSKTETEYERQSVLYSMKNFLLDDLKDAAHAYILEVGINQFLVVLVSKDGADAIAVLEQALERVRGMLGISVSCGVSENFCLLERLPYYFNQAIKAVSHKYYIGSNSMILFGDLADVRQSGRCAPDYQSDIAQMVALIKSGETPSRQKFAQLLQQFFLAPCYRTNEIKTAKAYLMEFTVMLFKTLERLSFISAENFAKENVYAQLLTKKTDDDAVCYIAATLEKLLLLNSNENRQYYNYIVTNAVKYIKEHYGENITLKDLAANIHVNASYLSRIIKNVTGENFIDILTKTRIDRAKILLSETTCRIYEVADIVGISDSKYFSSMFKKETGFTPTEYRNMANPLK